MNDQEHVYQPGFLLLFAPIFLFGATVGAGLTIALQAMGHVGYGVVSYMFLQLLSIIYLWAVVGAYIVAKLFAVKLTGDAIRGRTFWGTARSLEWSNVSDMRPLNIVGFRFLRIYPKEGGAPLWVPLFVKKKAEFLAAIESRASTSRRTEHVLP
jgi:hypothetical protein